MQRFEERGRAVGFTENRQLHAGGRAHSSKRSCAREIVLEETDHEYRPDCGSRFGLFQVMAC
jgi:hypothetical protein